MIESVFICGDYQATDWIFATNCTNTYEFG